MPHAHRVSKIQSIRNGTFEAGQYIFIYNHIRTNQVVYSLTRALHNEKALSQLPFLGRNTKPNSIRKDHWRPLAIVSFPSGRQGLWAFHKLREFRKRHEHEWSPQVDFPGKSLKQIKKLLGDQKANSIADLAAVLAGQERRATIDAPKAERAVAEQAQAQREEDEARTRLAELMARKRDAQREWAEAVKKQEEPGAEAHQFTKEIAEKRRTFHALKNEKLRIQRAFTKPLPYKALRKEYHPMNDERPSPKRGDVKQGQKAPLPFITMDGVKIQWSDVLDAEFAKSWPATVVHEEFARERGNRHRNLPPTMTALEETHGARQALEESKGSRRDPPKRLPVAEVAEEQVEEVVVEEDRRSGLQKLLARLRFGSPKDM